MHRLPNVPLLPVHLPQLLHERVTLTVASATPSPNLLAALLRGCATSDSEFVCKLNSILNLLYGVAIVLGLALMVTVWLALRAYGRNRDEGKDSQ